MSTPVASRAEAQARRLLAAYPWRMRAEQGDEIVATVLDTLPAGADRLPWRTALDLVRGGLRTRRQRRPPFLTRLAFWMGLRIHPRWIWWVYDRLEHPHYRRRSYLRRTVPLVALYLGLFYLRSYPRMLFLVLALVSPLISALAEWSFGASQRRQIRTRYGLVAGGSDPTMVWIRTMKRSRLPGRTKRESIRPVASWLVERIPGAKVWTPELDERVGSGEQSPDPAT